MIALPFQLASSVVATGAADVVVSVGGAAITPELFPDGGRAGRVRLEATLAATGTGWVTALLGEERPDGTVRPLARTRLLRSVTTRQTLRSERQVVTLRRGVVRLVVLARAGVANGTLLGPVVLVERATA